MKQQENKFSLLSLVFISIFFICLFTLSSFATSYLPGDFVGPMGDPTPDGKVDFNDLMVFATAYGSEVGDPNWNTLCDICGYLGDPSPDGKVNFDDLMVFATDYGKTLPVHNLTKGNYYGTIQAALDDADTNNTIEVSDGIYDESIVFQHGNPYGKLIVLRSVNGPSSTIIRGGDGLNTITFEYSPEGTTLEGFTITHTDGLMGRGIYSWQGNIDINNCTISNNSSTGYGGGLFNSAGTLTITGSTISGNSSAGSGGGIYNYNLYLGSTLTITGSTISGNTAGYAGGIYNDGILTITGSTITGNSAITDRGGICNCAGSYYGSILTMGGSSSGDKNTVCGNYKIGYSPSLDQQIRSCSENLYEIYKDTNYISADCTVIPDETVYRAFLVGVGDYVEDTYDLPEPPYDVDRMDYILSQCSFGPSNTQFSVISTLKDLSATKSTILQGIASVFSGSDDNDISYFYFSGHGYLDSDTNVSYLCPTDTALILDLSTMISVDELETALSAIAGTKVVFIGACHSGGFIGKGEEEVIISKEELGSFNQEIINVFSQAPSKGLLTTNQYQVLTSCRSDQISGGWEDPSVVDGPFGIFDMALCEGGGYFGNYPADTNSDNKVSLNEAYLYVIDWVNDFFEGLPPLDVDLQDVQVYPNNSTFIIIEY
jgi:hypothetical protein